MTNERENNIIEGNSKIKINGKNYNFPKSMRIGEAYKKHFEKENIHAVACIYNGKVKSFGHRLKYDGNLEFIDSRTDEGREVYVSGLMMVMTAAFNKLYPESEVLIKYQLHNAMYCSLRDEKITDKMMKNVKAEMEKIIKEDKIIKHQPMRRDEAEAFFKEHGYQRGGFQLYNKDKEKYNLYFIDDFYNYFYGIMPDKAGRINKFDIFKYDDGFLVMYPDRSNLDEIPIFKDKTKLYKTMKEYDEIYDLLGIQTAFELNQKVQKDPVDVVLLSEAIHERNISRLAEEIEKHKDLKLILIAGPSCSGKTTFANKITKTLRLNGIKPIIISVDNYFVDRENTPLDENGNYDFESLNAVDLELLNDHITRLINGEEIEMPEFNFKEGKKEYNGHKLKLDKDEILVMEGIHCLNEKLTEKIDSKYKFKVYISALTVLNMDSQNRISTTDTRLVRRILRDYRTRNYSAEETLKNWPSVRRGEIKNIYPFQEDADYMFNTSVIYEQNVLKDDVQKLLKEIPETSEVYFRVERLLTGLGYFESLSKTYIPNNSIIREFIGGSIYDKNYIEEIRNEHINSLEEENKNQEEIFKNNIVEKFKKLVRLNKKNKNK